MAGELEAISKRHPGWCIHHVAYGYVSAFSKDPRMRGVFVRGLDGLESAIEAAELQAAAESEAP